MTKIQRKYQWITSIRSTLNLVLTRRFYSQLMSLQLFARLSVKWLSEAYANSKTKQNKQQFYYFYRCLCGHTCLQLAKAIRGRQVYRYLKIYRLRKVRGYSIIAVKSSNVKLSQASFTPEQSTLGTRLLCFAMILSMCCRFEKSYSYSISYSYCDRKSVMSSWCYPNVAR